MQFHNIFVVPQVNRGGGLALLCRDDISLDVQTYSNQHIDSFINYGVDDTWWFTCFYKDPDIANREDS